MIGIQLIRRAVVGTVAFCVPVWAFASESLDDRLQPLISSHAGEVSVAVKNLQTGESFFHLADEVRPSASLIKLPVMIEAYRQASVGDIRLDQRLTLRDTDKVPGSGILTNHFSPGTELTLRNAIHLMIALSDNTATNLVLDQVGLDAVNKTMSQIGCSGTRINAKVYRRETSIASAQSRQFGLGSTTARQMIGLLQLLDEGQLVSRNACDSMLAHLYACDDRTKLPRFLPEDVRIAHKTGAVSQSRTDAGLIGTPAGRVAICVLTTNNDDRSWSDDNAANVLCGRVARAVYDCFHPAAKRQVIPLASGAHGRLVEDLQRTLNRRLQPSPELSVDGDFGPRTEAAVMRYQRQNQLVVNGVVGDAMWDRLGPLLDSQDTVADSLAINARRLPRDPADALDGPPYCTCKAWAVADADSGELLWSHLAGDRLDPASTTKIMTALVVLREARRHPELLGQIVEFSERADATIGSAAGIRAGERISVCELLYGLLLPSGNDASVALAEHVGQLLDESDLPVDPLERFVVKMNQTAGQLGLLQTRYLNPHGLTAAGHQTTAADLARLAAMALREPLFQDMVNTRQHGTVVDGAEGYRRSLIWKNTNQLLQQEGYVGVKTGTTDAAGACLVSCGHRNGRRLIVVVLGSASSAARYVDSRNLFRWAWLQLRDGPQTLKQRRHDPVLVSEQARRIHQAALLFDGHNDLPWRMRKLEMPNFDKFDIANPQPKLHTDIPRLRAGGVKAQFWSVYVPVDVAQEGKALLTTLEQIQFVKDMIDHYPDVFQLALTADDIDRAQQDGKIASFIGMEGGHCIEDSLNVLRRLYREGARYMTLTHSATLDWADSATDDARHDGLTPFGEEVVREMNRLGMLVDISHVAPQTMKDTLRISQAPIIFSHSSARAKADHPRNVPDDVLRLTAGNGGVVLVNFYSPFVVPSSAKTSVQRMEYQRELEEQGVGGDELEQMLSRWDARHPRESGSVHDVVDHIDHIVKVAGVDHVGLGADYDGVDQLPRQLEDVSTYPRITQELLNRGYSEGDIRKILGQNFVRVLRQAERVAKELQSSN